MENGVIHRQNGTTISAAADVYRRSPNIWARCPLGWIKKYYPEGHLRWDCSKMSLAGTQTTQIAGPIAGTKVFASTALVVDGVSSVGGELWNGAIRFGSDTDNDASSLAQAYPTFRMSGLPASSNRLWFEGCVALSSILTDTLGFFMGLAETELWTLSATVPFNAASAAIDASASAMGFYKGEDALGVVDTVVSDRATSWANIGDDEGSISAANTFAKFGFTYDPGPGNDFDSSKIIRFFQNNAELATGVTRAALIAYTNLDANALGPIFATITDASGTAALAYLKWLEVAQLPPLINP